MAPQGLKAFFRQIYTYSVFVSQYKVLYIQRSESTFSNSHAELFWNTLEFVGEPDREAEEDERAALVGGCEWGRHVIQQGGDAQTNLKRHQTALSEAEKTTGYPMHRENGKWPKKISVRENREIGNFAKTQGIWFAQVVNSLILKVKDITIFATRISNFSF